MLALYICDDNDFDGGDNIYDGINDDDNIFDGVDDDDDVFDDDDADDNEQNPVSHSGVGSRDQIMCCVHHKVLLAYRRIQVYQA